MKRSLTTLGFMLALAAGVSAQTKVTYRTNSFITGDNRQLTKIEYTDDSKSGPAQVWDYSNANIVSSMYIEQNPNNGTEIGGLNIGSRNQLLACDEGGEKDTYFEISKSQKMYWGLQSKTAKIQFNEPIVDLAFPFAYGDIISGPMDGIYTDAQGKEYPIEGQYFTQADAWGTIKLPDGAVYENVLRVKVEKIYSHALGSTNFKIHTIRYQYFAPGVRYPVMIALVSDTESDCNCACGKSHTEEAYYQTQESMLALRSTETPSIVDEQLEATFELSAYPNPFKNVLVAQFDASKAGAVELDILDASGKVIKNFGKFVAESGTNSVTLQTADLGLGHYVLRAQYEGETYTQNVVKK